MAFLDRFKKSNKKKEKSPAKAEQLAEQNKPEVKLSSKADKKVVPQVYQIIKEPHITEKAGFLTDQNKYVFKVSFKANKVEIKKIIEALYGVKVEKVHLIHSAPKKRRLGRSEGWRHGLKRGFRKAIITLAKGEKIELLPK